MEKVLKGLVRFQKEVFAKKEKLFASLSKQQNPSVLFITCSDSRIDPSLLTQTDPGDIFIIRNAGNLIPTYGAAIGGSTATIEYGVSVLQVKDIIVCGHTDCGAMKGLLHPEKLQDLLAVKAWMQHAETTVRIVKDHCAHLKGEELFAATIRENVLVQLDHLRTHPAVATRLRQGDLRLHGWVYSIGTGEVWVYDSEKKGFVDPSKRRRKARK
ncbi:MAG: carbonic anhydrase [Nitrospirales bacterium]